LSSFIEPCAPIFIVNEKTEYDAADAYRMTAAIWRRQNPGVGIYVDIELKHTTILPIENLGIVTVRMEITHVHTAVLLH